MKIHKSSSSLNEALLPFITNRKTIGFVPTMGALHVGHISLVEQANLENDCVVVSIFVNPTQFDNPNDLLKYPRTIENDIAHLKRFSKNIFIFSPSALELYNNNINSKSYNFSGIESEMEGKHRIGHFDGVGTVLNLFFRIIKPNKAYLGEKDFQQLRIVRKLVEIENLPVKVIGCPTIRETSGLAMSSRNKRLNNEQLKEAILIYKTLLKIKENFNLLSILKLNQLVEKEFKSHPSLTLEYFEIADTETLKTGIYKSKKKKYRAFIASFIGGIRLIDNMALN
ncbi:pantoate--beta-alanine ligase [Flavobacteriaceae bacterium]|jgi:pantoate--beta-alanine ligase|nr:pantoate--beta-alanine ligase [Flavobacteriaceae bacterium]MDB9913875.1 pantoate--beta-alanine ligase [Flavobacteriaceae bacterium]MDB9993128.1 pantoate--beta-alanine ligase [Flavobacteriaceae bacterium]